MAGRYNQAGPNLGCTSRATPATCSRSTAAAAHRVRRAAVSRPSASPSNPRSCAGWPADQGSAAAACWPGSSGPPESGRSPTRRRRTRPPAVADRYTLELQALAASLTAPVGNDGPAVLTLDPRRPSCCSASSGPGAAAGAGSERPGPAWPGGRPSSPAPPAASPPSPGRPPARRLGPADQRRHLRRRRPPGRLPGPARPGGVRPHGRRPSNRRRPLAAGLDQPHQAAQFTRRDAYRAVPQGGSPRPPTSTRPSACWRSTAGSAGSTPTHPGPRAVGRPPRGSWSTPCPRRQN